MSEAVSECQVEKARAWRKARRRRCRLRPRTARAAIGGGINTGNLETLMPLYESEAAFATLPGSLAHGAPGVRQALAGFISMTASSTSR